MFWHSSITIIQAIFLILNSILPITSPQLQQEIIHVNLIHRDSSLSPLYNPQESPYDRVRNSFARSKARLDYLINGGGTDNFQGTIEDDDGEYFVKFSIGTPSVDMLAVMDIASELVWTRCLPIFDSSKSSTYNVISCNSSECDLLPNWACDSSNSCSFIDGSTDFSRSNSILGRDIFTFETPNGVDCPLKDVIFSCEYDQDSTSPTQYNGILGLGFHNLSLIFQMSSLTEPKFTYCLGNYSDEEAENRLVLGTGLFLDGQTTTLKVIEGRYNLVLEGLSVGRKRLEIPPEIFQPSPTGGGDGGVIIDTGTMLSFLAPDAYYHLVEELEAQLGLNLEIWPDPPYERCYNGKVRDLSNFRGVIFHFDREVNVLLDIQNLFLQVEDGLFCLAILPSPLGGASVLGNLFQQSYSVGYHLGEMLISFQRIDCQALEKHLNG